jgi:hypothetical protein
MTGLSFSKETLESTMNTLTEDNALRMIGLAGGKRNFEEILGRMARTFNAKIPASATATIARASRRFTTARQSRRFV